MPINPSHDKSSARIDGKKRGSSMGILWHASPPLHDALCALGQMASHMQRGGKRTATTKTRCADRINIKNSHGPTYSSECAKGYIKRVREKFQVFFSSPQMASVHGGRWFNFAAAVENIYEHESTIQGDSHVNTCTKSGKSPFIISRKIRTQSKGKWKKLIRSDAGMWKNERKCTSSGCRCAVRSSKCATEAILCYQNVET